MAIEHPYLEHLCGLCRIAKVHKYLTGILLEKESIGYAAERLTGHRRSFIAEAISRQDSYALGSIRRLSAIAKHAVFFSVLTSLS